MNRLSESKLISKTVGHEFPYYANGEYADKVDLPISKENFVVEMDHDGDTFFQDNNLELGFIPNCPLVGEGPHARKGWKRLAMRNLSRSLPTGSDDRKRKNCDQELSMCLEDQRFGGSKKAKLVETLGGGEVSLSI